MKLICRRTIFIPGFCVFLLHHTGFGVLPNPTRDQLPSVTYRYAEWLNTTAPASRPAIVSNTIAMPSITDGVSPLGSLTSSPRLHSNITARTAAGRYLRWRQRTRPNPAPVPAVQALAE